MAHSDQIILVTGATGQQGGAAARHVMADGWQVRAFVRDPDKPAARALAEAGAQLVVGDLGDRASIDAAVEGAYGVYSMQVPVGLGAETAESKNLADAALAAGVKHLVYGSVMGADRPSDLPWVAGKVENERYLRSIDLPVTILRPTTFMENLIKRQRDQILGGKMTGMEPHDVTHQWIAVDDIGRFIALAFREPDQWIGRAVEIAGDELTGDAAAAALSATLGVPVVYEQLPSGPGGQAPAAAGPPPARADIPKLRESIPDLLTLAQWAALKRAEGVW